jgi:hypothetical protein
MLPLAFPLSDGWLSLYLVRQRARTKSDGALLVRSGCCPLELPGRYTQRRNRQRQQPEGGARVRHRRGGRGPCAWVKSTWVDNVADWPEGDRYKLPEVVANYGIYCLNTPGIREESHEPARDRPGGVGRESHIHRRGVAAVDCLDAIEE